MTEDRGTAKKPRKGTPAEAALPEAAAEKKEAKKTTKAPAAEPKAGAPAEDKRTEKARKAKGAPAVAKAPGGEEEEAPKIVKPRVPRLQEKYRQEVAPVLVREFGYSNVMQAPRVEKIILNMGLGEAIQNPKALESAEKDLTAISGQHPVTTRARRSIAAFKLRTGMPIGMMVTLRGKRMYDFLGKLVSSVLPRIRDFQGVSRDSFDGRGNYNLGMKEQIIFPEIEYDKVEKVRGLEITIVTTAGRDEEGRRLLELLEMPFVKG